MKTKSLSLSVLLIAAILLTACGSSAEEIATMTASAWTPIPATETLVPATAIQPEKELVYVSALCTLMGRPKETHIKAGEHVLLLWGWSATTQEYVQLYIDKSLTTVTFNGQEVTNATASQIEKTSNGKMYVVKWNADVGVLSPGTYEITYKVTFSEQISDGMDTYGPGGRYESLNDACTLIVE